MPLFKYELKNCPGMTVASVQLDFPAGGFTRPHQHSGAQVTATIVKGEMLSGINDNPPEVYGEGRSFVE